MPAPILHRDLWPTVGNLVHTIIATEGGSIGSISNNPPSIYRSAIYAQARAGPSLESGGC